MYKIFISVAIAMFRFELSGMRLVGKSILHLHVFVNICTCPCWPLISNQIFRHISGYVMGVDDDRVGR